MFTLETTRSATGPMAALANLLLLGKEGFRALLGHAVEMAEVLRERIESHPAVTVLNGDNVGPVTLFRAYPDGVDTFTVKAREQSDAEFQPQVRRFNEYNRRIFQRVHGEALAGRGVVISMTECYRHTEHGEPVAALKSYVLSPMADEARMESVLTRVLQARQEIEEPPPVD
jgi:glutamate/tyrosine decarboxylase-like PLP-dependent enzyme